MVINDLRRFDNVWMIHSTQRVHFTQVDVLFCICTLVQLLLVNFLGNVRHAGQLVPNLEFLIQPAILILGGLDAPDYLIELGELHRIPRDDRSFVIRDDTHLFFRYLNHGIKVILYNKRCMAVVLIELSLSSLLLLDITILRLILSGGFIFF